VHIAGYGGGREFANRVFTVIGDDASPGIIVGEDRQVIVDAGVDAAALSRVLQVLERR